MDTFITHHLQAIIIVGSALVAQRHASEGRNAISAAIVLVRDGHVVGVATAEEREPAPPPRRGLFGRLFGRKL